MNPLSDKQLELNQRFIDLIYEYEALYEDEPELKHPKELFKYIWNKGFMLREKDYTIF